MVKLDAQSEPSYLFCVGRSASRSHDINKLLKMRKNIGHEQEEKKLSKGVCMYFRIVTGYHKISFMVQAIVATTKATHI